MQSDPVTASCTGKRDEGGRVSQCNLLKRTIDKERLKPERQKLAKIVV